MSNTPRTAAAWVKEWCAKKLDHRSDPAHGMCDFAEQLETELTAAKELLREIRDGEVNAQDEADKYLRDHQPSALSVANAEVARLASDLKVAEIGVAFGALATKERDYERIRCLRVEGELTAANARIAELEKDAARYLDVVFSIAADGWLMHGPEGMDETQEAVYKVCKEHPTYKRLEAAAMENTNG